MSQEFRALSLEEKLRTSIEQNLSRVLEFKPYGKFEGVADKDGFIELIGNDPAFAPFFFNNPKYVTARIGGNLITSLHRKLGDLYEEVFAILLSEKLGVPHEDLRYSVNLNIQGRKQITHVTQRKKAVFT